MKTIKVSSAVYQSLKEAAGNRDIPSLLEDIVSAEISLPDWQRKILDARSETYADHPEKYLTWDQIKENVWGA